MAARCPNCTRKVHIWNNYTGFCSKRCREESRSACLNCGKVGLFKHERLGCCSDECRFWYVTTLLGYDREYLLTPAWDKVVYHVRLPSGNAEISSLQLDELEFERAPDTILVVAAPAWISKQKVLAELPYGRFDNPAWQHLRTDGTLAPEEIERFRSMCYDDPLLYHKLGEHVFEKIRGQGGTSPITPSGTAQLAPGGVPLTQPMLTMGGAQPGWGGQWQPGAPPALPAPAPLQLAQVSQAGASLAAPDHFAAQVRTLFALHGYEVSTANSDTVNTLLLTKGRKRAVAVYIWQAGMVSTQPVQRLLDLMVAWEATHGYVVTNGHFTLQAEDLVADRPVELIDGDELAALVSGTRSMSESAVIEHDAPPVENGATTKLRAETVALGGDGDLGTDDAHPHPALAMDAVPVGGRSDDASSPAHEPASGDGEQAFEGESSPA